MIAATLYILGFAQCYMVLVADPDPIDRLAAAATALLWPAIIICVLSLRVYDRVTS